MTALSPGVTVTSVAFAYKYTTGYSGAIRKIRVPLFATRSLFLKCHRSIPGHAIAVVREIKSSLWDTAGGKEPNIRPKTTIRRPLGLIAEAMSCGSIAREREILCTLLRTDDQH